jgi:hypothetical protein
MEADIKTEKALPRYCGSDTTFSPQLWNAVWQEKNDWEIWRQLGLEKY